MSPQFNVLDTESLSKEDAANLDAQQKAYWDKIDNLMHQVFRQNPKGKELLSIWQQTLMMTPTVTPNATQFEVGIAEGKKTVVREILLAINSVEAR